MLFLASVRHQSRRFVAPGVAVVLGVAFVAVALIIGTSLTTSLTRLLAGDIGTSAAVVTPASEDQFLDRGTLDEVAAVPGTQVWAGRSAVVWTSSSNYTLLTSVPTSTSGTVLLEGRMPTAAGEVAVDTLLARTDQVTIGDDVALSNTSSLEGPTEASSTVRVVGLVDTARNPALSGSRALIATDDTIAAITGQEGYDEIRVHSDQPAEEVLAAVKAAVGPGPTVHSGAEAAEAAMADFGKAGLVLSSFVSIFAAIAMFVCALVVANTFTVLLARRSRETALLRCVGSSRGQVIRSTLGEAGLLGLAFSLLGAVAGVGLVTGVVALLRRYAGGLFSVVEVALPWWALVVPVLLGVLVMVAASLRPVIRASRVAPLAALHPEAAVTIGSRRGRARIVLALVALLVGVAALALGAQRGVLALAVGGAMLSFLGLLALASVIVPAAASLIGRPVARLTGVPGELAVENALRNPARAASTASALLVGVTLIVMTFVGARTASGSALTAIEEQFPVDLMVSTSTPLPGTTVDQLGAVPGISAHAAVSSGVLAVGDEVGIAVTGVPEAVRSVSRNAASLSWLRPGTLVVPDAQPERGLVDGATVTVAGDLGRRDLAVLVDHRVPWPYTMRAEELAELTPVAADTVMLQVADGADLTDTMAAVTRVADQVGGMVGGAAPQRLQLVKALDIATYVAVGLLGMSVLIALIGIMNTLALSVHERRRESALLRALGVTRGQVRGALAIEGALLATVGATLGIVTGIGFGLAGAKSLLVYGGLDVVPAVPVATVVGIAVAAVVCGLLASALPGQAAAKVAPSAALALD